MDPSDRPQRIDEAGDNETPTGGPKPPPGPEELEKRLKGGASWFYWVAALSVINSVIGMAGGQWAFMFGLGGTQIVDALVAGVIEESPEAAGTARAVGLVMSVGMAGVFALFGWFARNRHLWAFMVGGGLYVIDALLFLRVGDYLGLAFHGWVLFALFAGFRAGRQLRSMSEAEATVMPRAA